MFDVVKPVGVVHPAPLVMVKLVFEISKKIFPIDSIFILAEVVAVFGMITLSLPSFTVLASKVLNVLPPSVEIEIFTLAQFTGDAVVLATAQVIFCTELPGHETPVFGAVTANGPAVLV